MKLKVCGMKYQNNLTQVAALQPNFLGFIFYEKSARCFKGESINNLPNNINKVGVFVNEKIEVVIDKINTYQLQAIQLHGEESPDYCDKLKNQLAKSDSVSVPIVIIKAFSINNKFSFDVLEPFETVCDYFLFDTKGKLPGGNGYMFDWNILNNYPSKKPFFLSGGIGLDDVEKIKKFKLSNASKYCYALDVNSKFEIKPGLKNIELLKYFKEKLKD